MENQENEQQRQTSSDDQEKTSLNVDYKKDLDRLLEYLWDDEQRHYLNCDEAERTGHIFETLQRLRQYGKRRRT